MICFIKLESENVKILGVLAFYILCDLQHFQCDDFLVL